MANCSNAYGEITLWVKGKDDNDKTRLVSNFKKLIDGVLLNCGYYTEIAGFSIGKEENEVMGVGDFYGCGRWSYEANCRYFYDWLKQGVESEKPELKPLWEELNKHEWRVIFSFSDEEGGCEVLYEMVNEVWHKAGEDKAEYKIISENDYDYTAENLVRLGVYDCIEDAREVFGN